MTDLRPLIPRMPVPDLTVPLVDGSTWRLTELAARTFTLVCFYRGRHCPQCQRQLQDLNRRAADFAEHGVAILAVSCDPRERAEDARRSWGLDHVPLGYGLPLATARSWGLFISHGRPPAPDAPFPEPALFSEPGLFLVRPDGTLYASIVQTMPFVRQHLGELIAALDATILPKGYPARGEVIRLDDRGAGSTGKR